MKLMRSKLSLLGTYTSSHAHHRGSHRGRSHGGPERRHRLDDARRGRPGGGYQPATMYRRFALQDELLSALIIAELDALENVVRGRLRFADQPARRSR